MGTIFTKCIAAVGCPHSSTIQLFIRGQFTINALLQHMYYELVHYTTFICQCYSTSTFDCQSTCSIVQFLVVVVSFGIRLSPSPQKWCAYMLAFHLSARCRGLLNTSVSIYLVFFYLSAESVWHLVSELLIGYRQVAGLGLSGMNSSVLSLYTRGLQVHTTSPLPNC